MKFDIVRAWKDENYRQSLSEEQLSALPANPAGEELNEADLASVQGGWDGGDVHKSSVALLCEVNAFTLNVNAVAIPVNLLTGAASNCQQNPRALTQSRKQETDSHGGVDDLTRRDPGRDRVVRFILHSRDRARGSRDRF